MIAPLAVVREADLEFGTIAVSPTSAGTMTLAPLSGAAWYAGGVSGVCASACPAPHPARFTVHGEPGRAYQISVPDRLTIPAVGGAVVVDSLVPAAASSGQNGRGILSAQGGDRFEVGGTLHVPAGAPAAQYTTQVPVIVDYL